MGSPAVTLTHVNGLRRMLLSSLPAVNQALRKHHVYGRPGARGQWRALCHMRECSATLVSIWRLFSNIQQVHNSLGICTCIPDPLFDFLAHPGSVVTLSLALQACMHACACRLPPAATAAIPAIHSSPRTCDCI